MKLEKLVEIIKFTTVSDAWKTAKNAKRYTQKNGQFNGPKFAADVFENDGECLDEFLELLDEQLTQQLLRGKPEKNSSLAIWNSIRNYKNGELKKTISKKEETEIAKKLVKIINKEFTISKSQVLSAWTCPRK